jgi:hypothetical protein
MPPLSDEDRKALEESIIEHGVLQPIIVDEHGEIIDGHHRARIAKKLGIEYPHLINPGFTDAEKLGMAITLNVARRHLTSQQKRDLLAQLIKSDAERSDRQHAEHVGVDHKTAAKVRNELEERGEIPHVDKRSDTKGRAQPATKPKLTVVDGPKAPKPKSKPSWHLPEPREEEIDPEAEIVKAIKRVEVCAKFSAEDAAKVVAYGKVPLGNSMEALRNALDILHNVIRDLEPLVFGADT